MPSIDEFEQEMAQQKIEELEAENLQIKERLLNLHSAYSDMKWSQGHGGKIHDYQKILSNAFSKDREFIFNKDPK